MSTYPSPKGNIGQVWMQMYQEKGDLLERSEAYARWTLANILRADRETHQQNTEMTKGSVMMGAKWVNH